MPREKDFAWAYYEKVPGSAKVLSRFCKNIAVVEFLDSNSTLLILQGMVLALAKVYLKMLDIRLAWPLIA